MTMSLALVVVCAIAFVCGWGVWSFFRRNYSHAHQTGNKERFPEYIIMLAVINAAIVGGLVTAAILFLIGG